jgi:hypothetical protein
VLPRAYLPALPHTGRAPRVASAASPLSPSAAPPRLMLAPSRPPACAAPRPIFLHRRLRGEDAKGQEALLRVAAGRAELLPAVLPTEGGAAAAAVP